MECKNIDDISEGVKIMSERKLIEYQEIGRINGRLEKMSIIYDG